MNPTVVFFGTAILLTLIAFLHDFFSDIYRKTLKYQTTHSQATVTKLGYIDAHMKWIRMGRKSIPIWQDKQYNVHLLFEGSEYRFNDQDLYFKVNIGDTVSIIVHQGYNKKGKIKHQYLSIDDE